MEKNDENVLLYIWKYKEFKINSFDYNTICNIKLQDLPNNQEITAILNNIKMDKSNINISNNSTAIYVNSERKKQTSKKWRCICKNNQKLNPDIWVLIQEYTEEFTPYYIKKIKNQLIDYSIMLLDNIIKDSMFRINYRIALLSAVDLSAQQSEKNRMIKAVEEKKRMYRIKKAYLK